MSFYTESQRQVQERFETRGLADTMEATIIADSLDDRHKAFISSRDFFFLSTVNANGEPTVSHKGGGVGTVKVIDDKTLAFPAYDGNGMFLSLGNIEDTAKIGLLFIDFETPNRVRVQATAQIQENDPLLSEYPGAIAVVRARVDQAFINCARYIHKHKRLETSRYVPDDKGDAPLAMWKRIDGMQGRLHPADEGRAENEGGVITEQQYGEALSKGES